VSRSPGIVVLEWRPRRVSRPARGVPIQALSSLCPCLTGAMQWCLRARADDIRSIGNCNNAANQKWQMARGSTAVKLAGTNFCLDAGSNPANGVQMKIWQVSVGSTSRSSRRSNPLRVSRGEMMALRIDLITLGGRG
jgi:hypothetical protein